MMSAIISLASLSIIVYGAAIVVRTLLSWTPLRSGTASYRVYSYLHDATEPYLRLFRRVLPPVRVGDVAIDLSSAVGLAVLLVALRVLALL